MDYGMADFGQKEGREGRKEGGRRVEGGWKGRFARSIEGGMEEERSQLPPPLLYYTTAENERKE